MKQIEIFLNNNPTINLFIQISIYLIPLIIAAIYAYKDFKRNKNSKKINKTGWFVIFLLITSFIAATINFIGTNAQNEIEKNSRTKQLKDVNDNLSEEIIQSKTDLKNEIVNLKNENDKLRKELNSNSIDLNRFLKGSDYKQISIELYKYKKGQLQFYIYNKSDLPLNGAQLSFQDYDQLKKCKISKFKDSLLISGECYSNSLLAVEDNFSLNPNTSTTSTPFPESTGDLHFAFYCATRNSYTTRYCVFRKTKENKYVQSYIIYDSSGKKILDKGKDPLKLGKKFWKRYFYINKNLTLEKVEN